MQVLGHFNHRSRFWFCFMAAAAIFIAAITLVPSFEAAGTAPSASYSRGILHVAISYRATQAGVGELTLEVLNPEDEVLDAHDAPCKPAKVRGDGPKTSNWTSHRRSKNWSGTVCAIASTTRMAKKLRWRETESIAHIIRTPVVYILGQQSYLRGGQAA